MLKLLLTRRGGLPRALPNNRSLHVEPTPRGAGIAIWCGLGITLAISSQFPDWTLPLVAVIAVSLWDDRRGVSPALRLLVQAGAAGAWIAMTWPSAAGVVAAILIIWSANLFNFMDGSDGLAATMGIVGFGAYAAVAWSAGRDDFTLLCCLVAATLPVLWMNRPPARVFLGDVGAVPLGFLAAVIGVAGWRDGAWPGWFPACVFLPFIADATLTLARRALHRERLWRAHREHYYQRLVQLGAGHAGTLAVYALLMVVGAAAAIGALLLAPAAPLLGPLLTLAWLLVILAVFAVIDHQWRKHGIQST